MPVSTVLVTGADGFVGRTLCPALESGGWRVRRAVRTSAAAVPASDIVTLGDIGVVSDRARLFDGIDAVVHLAARVHRTGDRDLDEFRRVNTAATRRLAEDASRAGVRRFVYLSSVKVMGESSPPGRPLHEGDPPRPADAYALSKWEAEQALSDIGGPMQVVILRPPLVYGPAVGANFLQLLRWIDRGMWLPFGAVRNQRSLLFVGNLASAIAHCLTHPNAAGMTFLVSDRERVSTADLIDRVSVSLGRSNRCWPVPVPALRAVATIAGMRARAQRLLDSLVVDAALISRRLGWHPPYSLDDGLRATVAWYRTASM